MIRLDDTPIRNWGFRVQNEHEDPLISEMRTRTLTIPGMFGEYDFGSELGAKQFNFPLGIIEYNNIQKQRKLRDFVAFLFDQYGRPRQFKLTFDDEPEMYYMVKVSNGFTPQKIFGFAFFDLPLVAHDPFKYADSSYKQEGAITGIKYDQGHLYPVNPNEIYFSSTIHTFGDAIPFLQTYDPNFFYENPTSFKWIYSKHTSGLYNHSYYHTAFEVEISGTVTNPKITNQATGKTLFLPSIRNQKMKIDTSKFNVTVNDNNKLADVLGIEDFMLQSGDNPLLFESTSTPNATVTYKWKHKFL